MKRIDCRIANDKRSFCLWVFLGCFLVGPSLEAVEWTLQARLQQALNAFSEGNYSDAAAHFRALEADFADEPEYARLPPVILPAWAYAEAQAGSGPAAIALFEQFLRDYPKAEREQEFVLYSLANVYQSNGQYAEAIEAYGRFIELAPEAPEAELSALRQAELLFALGRVDEAIARLDAFSRAPSGSPTLQVQARLRAIQEAQAGGQDAVAAKLLLERPWSVQAMPELAVLAYAALQAGDYLMRQAHYPDAIRAFRLVPPKAQLVALQQQRLNGLQQAMAERKRRASRGLPSDALWMDYYRRFIQEVAHGLETLQAQEDYTPALQLRLAEAFLLAERPREARLLSQYLAAEPAIDKETQAQAHYRWILAEEALQAWDRGLRAARQFEARHPQHALAPYVLFVSAHLLQNAHRYNEAIAPLARLLEQFPEHPLAPQAEFTRGFTYTLAEDYPAARAAFARYGESYPRGNERTQARMWSALTFFFEKDYAEARRLLDALLAETPPGNATRPEIRYRQASVLYALRDYEAAQAALEEWLADYPEGVRRDDVLALLGDSRMALGALATAQKAYQKISPDAAALYTYGMFQIGKILRAEGRHAALAAHFQTYLNQNQAARRQADALYWIGWASLQSGHPDKARARFHEAIDLHGNDPEAGNVQHILEAMQQLGIRSPAPTATRSSAPQGGTPFADFLRQQREQAEREGTWTWFARLSFYLARLEDKNGHPERAEALRWEVIEKVPLEQLDPEGLAAAGNLLAASGFGHGQHHYQRLVANYPHNPASGIAYYALAKVAVEEADWPSAERLLKHFQENTPLHPVAPQVGLLLGHVLSNRGKYTEAIDAYAELLRQKTATGQTHAEALMGMAQSYAASQRPEQAIATYQRVYTLYRAYPELLTEAYHQSARLFEGIGQPEAAVRTYMEMLGTQDIQALPAKEHAQRELARLEASLKPDHDAEGARP